MVAVAAADVMVVAATAAAANIVIAAMNINCNGMLLLYAFRICCGRPGTTANR